MRSRIRDYLVEQHGEVLVDYVAPSKRKSLHINTNRLNNPNNYMTDAEKQTLYTRDQAIIDSWLSGKNFRECGEPHGISLERVRQIIYRETRKGFRRKAAESVDEWRERVILELLS